MNWFKKIILGVLLTGCMDNNVQPMGFLTKAAIGSGIVVGAAVAVGGAAVASSYLIPFRFPEPTGLFGVGTEIHHLNNSNKFQYHPLYILHHMQFVYYYILHHMIGLLV